MGDNVRRWGLAAAIVVVLLSLFALQLRSVARARHDQITSYSKGGAGLSRFLEFAPAEDPLAVSVLRRAVLEAADLEQARTLLLLSPSIPLSTHEAQRIAAWVRAGNRIVVSFHDLEGLSALRPLFLELPTPEPAAVAASSFENGVTVRVTAESELAFFEAGKTYEFYGRLRLGSDCDRSTLSCFVERRPAGSGELVILAGIPPISNALLGRADNRRVALDLVERGAPLLVDEYHHFFTEHTLGDLLSDPRVTLPAVSILAAPLLYLLLGHGEFHERSLARARRRPARSFHDVNRGVLLTALRRIRSPEEADEATRIHRDYLMRLFPDRAQEIGKASSAARSAARHEELEAGLRLLRLHQSWLHERGQRS